MDAVETLQGSSLESKAERIARYKAERRRELAERYATLEDISSKYTRRDRHRDTADAPDAASSSEQKPKEVASPTEASARAGEKEAWSESDRKQNTLSEPASKPSLTSSLEGERGPASRPGYS